jgi:hypothetical protein
MIYKSTRFFLAMKPFETNMTRKVYFNYSEVERGINWILIKFNIQCQTSQLVY